MDDMLAGSNNDDLDLFGEEAAPVPSQEQNEGIDAMLADNDDDDLFSAPQGAPEGQESQPEAETSSALIRWQQEKDGQLRELDANESTQNQEMQSKAKESLDRYYKNLAESQENRAKLNRETDEQSIADRDSTTTQSWEKVVKFIDFNRSDLHERDVSRMKSLLLQLKH
ncbi:clathrin light chain A-like protein [Tritrichomonas foetus]|uniref:Clathrin light chain n=1 Tax=Tritrichomonas foetus TaxID=1144522 RepID=A0A1J4KSF8_9EUKA|nr:clathrin light chain A-like protein [Tritrichomonas foetus]|eukprot:OHT14195.1 clathrin light chain A-like protein [Tritrichomonas foetus]